MRLPWKTEPQAASSAAAARGLPHAFIGMSDDDSDAKEEEEEDEQEEQKSSSKARRSRNSAASAAASSMSARSPSRALSSSLVDESPLMQLQRELHQQQDAQDNQDENVVRRMTELRELAQQMCNEDSVDGPGKPKRRRNAAQTNINDEYRNRAAELCTKLEKSMKGALKKFLDRYRNSETVEAAQDMALKRMAEQEPGFTSATASEVLKASNQGRSRSYPFASHVFQWHETHPLPMPRLARKLQRVVSRYVPRFCDLLREWVNAKFLQARILENAEFAQTLNEHFGPADSAFSADMATIIQMIPQHHDEAISLQQDTFNIAVQFKLTKVTVNCLRSIQRFRSRGEKVGELRQRLRDKASKMQSEVHEDEKRILTGRLEKLIRWIRYSLVWGQGGEVGILSRRVDHFVEQVALYRLPSEVKQMHRTCLDNALVQLRHWVEEISERWQLMMVDSHSKEAAERTGEEMVKRQAAFAQEQLQACHATLEQAVRHLHLAAKWVPHEVMLGWRERGGHNHALRKHSNVLWIRPQALMRGQADLPVEAHPLLCVTSSGVEDGERKVNSLMHPCGMQVAPTTQAASLTGDASLYHSLAYQIVTRGEIASKFRGPANATALAAAMEPVVAALRTVLEDSNQSASASGGAAAASSSSSSVSGHQHRWLCWQRLARFASAYHVNVWLWVVGPLRAEPLVLWGDTHQPDTGPRQVHLCAVAVNASSRTVTFRAADKGIYGAPRTGSAYDFANMPGFQSLAQRRVRK